MDGTIGEVKIFAGNFAPRSWAFCDGQTLAIAQYNALFSILGTYYGGDGRTSFQLPDLRGRVPVGVGTGTGLNPVNLGQMGGTQYHTLSVNEMPQHNHTAQASASGATVGGTATATMHVHNTEAAEKTPSGGVLGKSAGSEIYMDASDGTTLNADAITVDATGLTVDISGLDVAIDQAGGSQMFSIMQPYLGMYWIICLEGIFPSRE